MRDQILVQRCLVCSDPIGTRNLIVLAHAAVFFPIATHGNPASVHNKSRDFNAKSKVRTIKAIVTLVHKISILVKFV